VYAIDAEAVDPRRVRACCAKVANGDRPTVGGRQAVASVESIRSLELIVGRVPERMVLGRVDRACVSVEFDSRVTVDPDVGDCVTAALASARLQRTVRPVGSVCLTSQPRRYSLSHFPPTGSVIVDVPLSGPPSPGSQDQRVVWPFPSVCATTRPLPSYDVVTSGRGRSPVLCDASRPAAS